MREDNIVYPTTGTAATDPSAFVKHNDIESVVDEEASPAAKEGAEREGGAAPPPRAGERSAGAGAGAGAVRRCRFDIRLTLG